MEIVAICILSTLSSLLIIFSYTLGLKNGQKIKNNIPVETPKVIEPLKDLISTSEDTSDLTEEQQAEWDNINNYDGTNRNQKTLE